ncbi:MAG: DUF371 domain-containing protein [Thermosphaera sp.]
MASEQVTARGHFNITGRHKTTLEITRERDLTVRGDCIIGVEADKATSDFSSEFKKALRDPRNVLLIILEARGIRDFLLAHCSSSLILSDTRRIIVRRSGFIEPATIGLHATKAAGDLNRELINALKNGETVLKADFYVLRLEQVEAVDPSTRGIL